MNRTTMKDTRLSVGLLLTLAALVLNAPLAWAVCGEGVLDAGEQCDVGADPTGTCCTASCTFVAANTECRPAAGDRDVAEVCTGLTALCPPNLFKPPQVCRPAAGV
jgi:hypothetical protein